MRHSHTPHAIARPDLAACHDCDLLLRPPRLKAGEKARCPRCGALLFESKDTGFSHTLALALASLVLFALANVNTMMTMKVGGRMQSGAIFSGVQELYAQGYWEIAALVFVVSILAPLAKILCLFYVLWPLRWNARLPYAVPVFRLFSLLHPWAMTEVYMLGILVAMVKLADLATLDLGVALYAFAALIVCMAATDASLDEHAVWQRLGKSR
ncbi:MAG: paraquat-inducible protein A [Candidatus Methylumidiphilus sp.]